MKPCFVLCHCPPNPLHMPQTCWLPFHSLKKPSMSLFTLGTFGFGIPSAWKALSSHRNYHLLEEILPNYSFAGGTPALSNLPIAPVFSWRTRTKICVYIAVWSPRIHSPSLKLLSEHKDHFCTSPVLSPGPSKCLINVCEWMIDSPTIG